jgi:hypothetical protein
MTLNIRNWNWQAERLDEVKSLLGHCLVTDAPRVEDLNRNTDLVMMQSRAGRIACRVRRWPDRPEWASFLGEFTVRTRVGGGGPTEIDKVLGLADGEEFGDYLFYGVAAPSGDRLAGFLFADLDIFRKYHQEQVQQAQDEARRFLFRPPGPVVDDGRPVSWPGVPHRNRPPDQDTYFRSYDVNEVATTDRRFVVKGYRVPIPVFAASFDGGDVPSAWDVKDKWRP